MGEFTDKVKGVANEVAGKVKEASMRWFQDDYTIPCAK